MKILITGSHGFLGSHLLQELSKQELGLKTSNHPKLPFTGLHQGALIEGLDVENNTFDLSDKQQANQAVRNCQIIFHAEHLVSFKNRDKNLLDQINLRSTENLLEAASRNGVEKFVYVSGMETLTASPGQKLITEKDGVLFDELESHFEKTRYLAEKEVLKFRQHGLPVVIVHPTVGLGNQQYQKTLFGKFVHRLLKRKVHFYIDSGLNFADIEDIAKGCLLAAKRGKIGSRYILGNQNIYLLEFLQKFEELAKVPTTRTALPTSFAHAGNWVVQNLLGLRRGTPNAVLHRLRRPLFYDCALAHQELGMPQSNIWEALKKQIDELRQFDLQ